MQIPRKIRSTVREQTVLSKKSSEKRDKWLGSHTIFLSKWWKTILTVIIVVILFLLFAFYICNHIMS